MVHELLHKASPSGSSSATASAPTRTSGCTAKRSSPKSARCTSPGAGPRRSRPERPTGAGPCASLNGGQRRRPARTAPGQASSRPGRPPATARPWPAPEHR
jgi:hypothetical protein